MPSAEAEWFGLTRHACFTLMMEDDLAADVAEGRRYPFAPYLLRLRGDSAPVWRIDLDVSADAVVLPDFARKPLESCTHAELKAWLTVRGLYPGYVLCHHLLVRLTPACTFCSICCPVPSCVICLLDLVLLVLFGTETLTHTHELTFLHRW